MTKYTVSIREDNWTFDTRRVRNQLIGLTRLLDPRSVVIMQELRFKTRDISPEQLAELKRAIEGATQTHFGPDKIKKVRVRREKGP